MTRMQLSLNKLFCCCIDHADMSNQQLMAKGRKDIVQIDKTLARAERIAEDTLQVGVSVGVPQG